MNKNSLIYYFYVYVYVFNLFMIIYEFHLCRNMDHILMSIPTWKVMGSIPILAHTHMCNPVIHLSGCTWCQYNVSNCYILDHCLLRSTSSSLNHVFEVRITYWTTSISKLCRCQFIWWPWGQVSLHFICITYRILIRFALLTNISSKNMLNSIVISLLLLILHVMNQCMYLSTVSTFKWVSDVTEWTSEITESKNSENQL